MSYQENIFELFKAAHEADKDKYIKNWMVNWSYQDKRTKRQVDYEAICLKISTLTMDRATLCLGTIGKKCLSQITLIKTR